MSQEYDTPTAKFREGVFRFGQRFNLANLKFVGYRDPLGVFLTQGIIDDALDKGFDCVKPGTEDHVSWNDELQTKLDLHYPEQLQAYYFAMRDGKSLIMNMDANNRLISRAFARRQYSVQYDEFGDIESGEAKSEILNSPSFVTTEIKASKHQFTGEETNNIEIIFKRKEKINEGMSYLEPIWDVLFAIYMLVSHSAYFVARAGAGMKRATLPESAMSDEPNIVTDMETAMVNWGSAADTIFLPETINGVKVEYDLITVDNPLKVTEYLDFYLSLISARTGIPVPVLRGIITGELTAGEVTEASYFDFLHDIQKMTDKFNKWFVNSLKNYYGIGSEEQEDFDLLYRTRKVISEKDRASLLKAQLENVELAKKVGIKTTKALTMAGFGETEVSETDLKEGVDDPIDFRPNAQNEGDADKNDKNLDTNIE